MAKSTDFPIRIREFGMAISRFSHRHYDYDIFTDFIDYMICCLLWEGEPETVERLKKKYENEYANFHELYKAFFKSMLENLGGDDSFDWYDVLGEIYETISSGSKASALGQFFTPKPICDVMAQMTIEKGDQPKAKRVNDCACGSARTLLAYNKIAPGNQLYGEDYDPICSKMAAINLAVHGCKGQVCNMDSLNPERWFFGYEINPRLYTTGGIPHIVKIEKEQSFTWSHWQHVKQEFAEKKQEQNKIMPVVENLQFGQQLTFF